MAIKNKTLSRVSKGFGAKSLTRELDKAKALINLNKWTQAQLVLDDLSRTYPDNSEILTYLA